MSWERDPVVIDMVRHLEQPNKIDNWDALTSKEIRAIQNEIVKCRNDFSYAARNYFEIVNKQRQDIPFSLQESQELILEKWHWYRDHYPDKAQKLLILKARQLGASTLIEGLIAWKTIFFSNVEAMVVSNTDTHASYLFSMMLHFYERLPWFLKPMIASHKQDDALFFANPDYESRRERPGNNSRVTVQSAKQTSGVGQGMTLTACHLCFAPDTIVRMADGAIRPITEVSFGDPVITASGLPTKVVGVYESARHSEETAKITIWGLPNIPLETTLDHRIVTPSGYRQAGDLQVGDAVIVPVRKISNKIKSINIVNNKSGGAHGSRDRTGNVSSVACGYDLGWLCGLYLAEGTIQINKRLRPEYQPTALFLSIHKKEEKAVTENILKVFPGIRVSRYHHKSQTCVLRISVSGIGRFLYREFGAGPSKTIPAWAWDAGAEFCRGIVAGYLYGDGHVDQRTASVMASSVRAAISVQLRDMVASLGCGWSSIYRRRAGHWYGRNCQEVWIWLAAGETAQRACRLIGSEIRPPKTKCKSHWSYVGAEGHLAVNVSKVERGFSDNFYDLEVESEEHNFCTLQCCVANSEFTDWDFDKFREIIYGDLIHAVADTPNSFVFLESTGKGSGTPAEEMWLAQVHLGERAKWLPVFLPWFFERKRFIAPEAGWHPQEPETDMQAKARRDWVRCTSCKQYFESSFRLESRVGRVCGECGKGTMEPLVLTDGQLRFMENERVNAEAESLDAVKKLREELSSTAEECFQLSGIQIFGPECHQWVIACLDNNPKIWGNIDDRGNLHYVKDYDTGKCGLESCQANHRFDPEQPLQIWELPDPNAKYCIGVDVAEGLGGRSDYSVIFVNKYYENGRGPDEQVALWRSNNADPIALASPVNWLGRLYNDALVAIEVNKFDSCEMWVRMNYLYPNNFVWKHYDSKNPMSNKLGWVTNMRTKPMLWQTAVRRLKSRMWIIRSDIFAEEMKRFQKDDYDDNRAEAEKNFHDDVLMAGFISLFCAHDLDYSEGMGYIPVGVGTSADLVADFTNTCGRCRETFKTEIPARRCPRCKSMLLTAKRNTEEGLKKIIDFSELGKTPEEVALEMGEELESSEDASPLSSMVESGRASYPNMDRVAP